MSLTRHRVSSTKMKFILIFAFLLLSSFSFALDNEISRYSIIAVDLWDPTENINKSTLIKLDTATGRIWRLERVSSSINFGQGDTNLLIEGWVEIDKPLTESFREYEVLKKATERKK